MKNKSSRARMQVVFGTLLFVLALIADLYVMINAPAQYLAVAALTAAALVCVYITVNGVLVMQKERESRSNEQNEYIYKSGKASFLVSKKNFEELGDQLTRMKDASQLPAEEIVNAQKGIAKVIINYNRENTDAIMNSNDIVAEQMQTLSNRLDELAQAVAENRNAIDAHLDAVSAVVSTGREAVLENQEKIRELNEKAMQAHGQDLVVNMKDMELRINNAIMQLQKVVAQAPVESVQTLEQPVMAEETASEAVSLVGEQPELDAAFADAEDVLAGLIDELPEAELSPEGMLEAGSDLSLMEEQPEAESDLSLMEEQPEAESDLLLTEELSLEPEAELSSESEFSIGSELSLESEQPVDSEVELSSESEFLIGSELSQESEQPVEPEAELSSEFESSVGPELSQELEQPVESEAEPSWKPDFVVEPDFIVEPEIIEELSKEEPAAEVIAEPKEQETPPMPDLSDPNKALSLDEIDALFANMGVEVKTPEVEPAAEPDMVFKPDVIMDSDLLGEPQGMSEPEAAAQQEPQGMSKSEVAAQQEPQGMPESAAEPEESNEALSMDEIDALFASMGVGDMSPIELAPEPEPIPIPIQEEKPSMPDLSDPNKAMSADEIAALFANLA